MGKNIFLFSNMFACGKTSFLETRIFNMSMSTKTYYKKLGAENYFQKYLLGYHKPLGRSILVIITCCMGLLRKPFND